MTRERVEAVLAELREVEDSASDRPGGADRTAPAESAIEPPEDGDDPTFDAPWQARAFALTVALRRNEAFAWEAFQDRLVDAVAEVETDDEATYYEAWLDALAGLLLDEGLLTRGELAERVAAFERGERDAGEFVVGDHGHGHAGGHEHPHVHDGSHDH